MLIKVSKDELKALRGKMQYGDMLVAAKIAKIQVTNVSKMLAGNYPVADACKIQEKVIDAIKGAIAAREKAEDKVKTKFNSI